MKIQKQNIPIQKGQYEIYQNRFNEYLQKTNQTLGIESVRGFMETLDDSSSSTQRKALTSIKQAIESMTYNELEKMAIQKEFKKIKIKKPDKKIGDTKTLLDLEIQTLKSEASYRLRLIIELLEMTGCRISEVTNIKHKDMTMIDDDIISVKILGKGMKERSVLVPTSFVQEIREEYKHDTYLFCNKSGNPLGRLHVAKELDRLSQKTGIKINAHKLRHTFATNMIVREKENVKAVSNYLGHSTPAITLEMYTHDTLDMKSKLRLYRKAG